MQEMAEAEEVEQARAAEDAAVAQKLTEADQRLLDWHWANLEYGCSSRLSDVSLAHWNQVNMHICLRPCIISLCVSAAGHDMGVLLLLPLEALLLGDPDCTCMHACTWHICACGLSQPAAGQR